MTEISKPLRRTLIGRVVSDKMQTNSENCFLSTLESNRALQKK